MREEGGEERRGGGEKKTNLDGVAEFNDSLICC